MEIFGFTFERTKKARQTESEALASFAPPVTDDGALNVAPVVGGSVSQVLDLEGTAKSEADLVTRYREMSLQPIVERAIDDIVDEAIVADGLEPPVTIETKDLPYSDSVKEAIAREFDHILGLMDFHVRGPDHFRRWYIDGRIYYHVIIDENKPEEGIKELRYLDPRKIRKVREQQIKRKDGSRDLAVVVPKTEYFVYSERGFDSHKAASSADVSGQAVHGIRISRDSIIHVTSGRLDPHGKMVLSYLHKAIRPLNQLLTMEDARVIYSMTRAPERRIWYIDVGGLPKAKAEQHLRDMMTKHKNRLQYDATTGEIKDDRRFMTMLDDFWLPRRSDGKATEVTTLPGGQGLGEIDEILYFRKNLYTALNIPISRLEPETGFALGRATEVSRDEVKFAKFIWRLRTKFSEVFTEALIRQLLLRRVIGAEDVEVIRRNIRYRYAADNYFSELKEAEILRERLNSLQQIDDYIGKYFSKEYVWTNVLRMTENEIKLEKERMEKEAEEDPPEPEDDVGSAPPGMMGEPAAPETPPAAPTPPQESHALTGELIESTINLNQVLQDFLVRR